MTKLDRAERLLKQISASPTPYHCVAEMSRELLTAGFEELGEKSAWKLRPDGTYLVVRHGSLIAFRMPRRQQAPMGFQIAGSHTDSPCLKVKPNPEIQFKGYLTLGVEVYGGVLLSTWFDRDLGLAGQISYQSTDGKLVTELTNIGTAVATIPNLAIHLNRTVNENRTINPQLELPPLVSLGKTSRLEDILAEHHPRLKTLLSHDLFFYDLQPPAFIGGHKEFIASARLDNQLSCFIGLGAFIGAAGQEDTAQVFVANDHEEVGSGSQTGAAGTFLKSVLQRISNGSDGEFHRSMAATRFLSLDNAHGIHPNYRDKHDQNHGPLLGQGPVLKINANQRYASSNRGLAYLRAIGEGRGVPLQAFVVRSDMACGSTIGPITAALIGAETVDIGVPTFAMHSIRELAGTADINFLADLVLGFYEADDPG